MIAHTEDFLPEFIRRPRVSVECADCRMVCMGGHYGSVETPYCRTCANFYLAPERSAYLSAKRARDDERALNDFFEAVQRPDFSHVTVRRMAPLAAENAHAYRRDDTSPTGVLLVASADWAQVKADSRSLKLSVYPGATYGLTRNC